MPLWYICKLLTAVSAAVVSIGLLPAAAFHSFYDCSGHLSHQLCITLLLRLQSRLLQQQASAAILAGLML